MNQTPATDAVKTMKSMCSECGRETTHYVRAESRRGSSKDDEFAWSQFSYFLECGGCEWTSIRKVYWDDNCSPPDEPDVKLFPPGLYRRKPEWLWNVDERFLQLFEEVYTALAAGTVAVPVMGARAILDVVIQDQVGDRGNFAAGLDALTEKGFVSEHDRRILDAAVEAGNAAAHRGFFPTEENYRSGNCDPRGVEPRVASPPDGDRRRGGATDGHRITRRTDGGLRGVAE